MDRNASAVWHGSLKEGKGTISTQSGTLKDTQYSFAARFAEGVGTNPEELIAAAHAGCFSMALSAILSENGHVPKSVHTVAKVTFDPVPGGFAITVSIAVSASRPSGATTFPGWEMELQESPFKKSMAKAGRQPINWPRAVTFATCAAPA